MAKDERALQILQLMADERLTQKAAGQRLGMSEQAVSKCLSKYRKRNAQALALNPATTGMIQRQLDELGETIALNEKVRGLIQLIEDVLTKEATDLFAARSHLRKICDGSPDKFLIALLQERRKLLEFHFTMRKEYASMQAVQQFQTVVLDEIQKADPATAQRIALRLAELRNVREAVEMPQSAAGGV